MRDVPVVKEYLPFIVIGVITGSVYGIAALGLVLTYKTSGVFNFGHGAIAAASAVVFYELNVEQGQALADFLYWAITDPQVATAARQLGYEPIPPAVRDQAIGERERLQQDAVRRALVVEREALPGVADHRDAARVGVP